MNGDLGTAALLGRSGAAGVAPDRRGGTRGRSSGCAWPRTLRARRWGEGLLPQWLSAGQGEDRGRGGGLFGAAGPDTPEPFISGVRAALSGRTRELERLAVELLRAACRRATSRTRSPTIRADGFVVAAVSEITEKLWAEYEDFCKRDLSEHAIVYLFVDGIAERLRPGQRRVPSSQLGGSARTDANRCWG